MTDVTEAISIAKSAAPTLGVSGRALLVAIGGLESHWGDAWQGTNNWGAITAGSGWTGATFEHADSRWTPSGVVRYVTNFRSYPTAIDGAKDLAQLLAHQYSKALSAASDGNWLGASAALYDAGYYTGTRPRAGAIADHYKRLREFLIEQGITPAMLGAAMGLEWLFWAGLGYFVLRRKLKGTHGRHY
jgi:hypothetical protein